MKLATEKRKLKPIASNNFVSQETLMIDSLPPHRCKTPQNLEVRMENRHFTTKLKSLHKRNKVQGQGTKDLMRH